MMQKKRTTIRVPERCFSRASLGLFLILFLLSEGPGLSQENPAEKLSKASLEQLMNLEVTSPSKKEQKLSHVAAAIYVITQDDIRRSGARNIPDLLRMVPGLDVAQIDANSWAVSIRGFNGLYANKLLVLVDGRSVYDASFGGVFWDSIDMPLGDIERIEVIRGPGGTVWGANAVNGVINIITRQSQSTQGGLVSLGTGSQRTADGVVQVGGKIRSKGFYRVYGKYFNESSRFISKGQRGADGWRMSRAGFRSDLTISPKDSATVEGDLYDSLEGQTIQSFTSLFPPGQGVFNDPVRGRGGSILAHWDHKSSDRSSTSLQIYYDGIRRLEYGLQHNRDTLDLEFENHYTLNSRNDAVWGLDYRLNAFYDRPGYAVALVPPGRTDNLFGGFFQDELRLSDSTWLTWGSKLEHNDYTGFEVEPSAQIVWTPDSRQAVWGMVARAIRQPSREDVDLAVSDAAFYLPNGMLALAATFGNPNLRSEKLMAYEAGYRLQAGNRLSFDIATFYNDYHDLTSIEPSSPYLVTSPPPAHLVFPTMFGNKLHGETHGAEISSSLNLFNWWKVSPSYSFLRMSLQPDAGSLDTSSVLVARDSPRHQFQIRSNVNLPGQIEFDSDLYYVSSLPDQKVRSYAPLDARLDWRPRKRLEFSITGQNLLQTRHFEFGQTQDPVQPTQVPRSIFGEVQWTF